VVIDGGDRACVRLLLELRARISGLPDGTVILYRSNTRLGG
jgi:tRNA 2-thiouridine synthesizing protein A